MNTLNDEYVLVAKRCPSCQSLVMARLGKESNGDARYDDYRCSNCDWKSPIAAKG